MTLAIKKLHPDAIVPSYAHPGDAGMDLFSVIEATLQPGERQAIPTGIAMHLAEGTVGLVWDKSGRALKEGLKTMAGVIDAGYRGEVQIVIVNLGQEPLIIEKHQKIAQLLIQPVLSPTIQEVESLEDSSRGEGGFGSTGL